MNAGGWYLDPYGEHEHRWFSDGRPTDLVRDNRTESRSAPPAVAYAGALVPAPERPANGSDLLRADSAAAGDQSFTQGDGMRAVLEGSGAMGLGFV